MKHILSRVTPFRSVPFFKLGVYSVPSISAKKFDPAHSSTKVSLSPSKNRFFDSKEESQPPKTQIYIHTRERNDINKRPTISELGDNDTSIGSNRANSSVGSLNSQSISMLFLLCRSHVSLNSVFVRTSPQ